MVFGYLAFHPAAVAVGLRYLANIDLGLGGKGLGTAVSWYGCFILNNLLAKNLNALFLVRKTCPSCFFLNLEDRAICRSRFLIAAMKFRPTSKRLISGNSSEATLNINLSSSSKSFAIFTLLALRFLERFVIRARLVLTLIFRGKK